MPMNSKLSFAQSKFSKGRSATEPSDEPPLHPTELNLVMRLRVWLDKLAPLAFARYLIAFFIGVAATLAWQSYRDATREQTIALLLPVSIWCGKASIISPSRSPSCRRPSRISSTGCQHLRRDRPLPRHAIPCCDRRKHRRCVDPQNGQSGFVPRLCPCVISSGPLG